MLFSLQGVDKMCSPLFHYIFYNRHIIKTIRGCHVKWYGGEDIMRQLHKNQNSLCINSHNADI